MSVPTPAYSLKADLLKRWNLDSLVDNEASGPVQQVRQRLLRTEVRHILAGIELGWLPADLASPAIRLEYLRCVNGAKGSQWVAGTLLAKKPNDKKKGASTAGDWRTKNTLMEAISSEPEQGLLQRRAMYKILTGNAHIESAELPWVLNGSRPIAGLETPKQRAKWLVEVALADDESARGDSRYQRLPKKKIQAKSAKGKGRRRKTAEDLDDTDDEVDAGIDHGGVLDGLGLPSLNALGRASSDAERLTLARHLTERTTPALTAEWILTGKTLLPPSVSSLVAFYRERGDKVEGAQRWREQKLVTLEVTNGMLRRLWSLALKHADPNDPDDQGLMLLLKIELARASYSPLEVMETPLSVNGLLAFLKPASHEQGDTIEENQANADGLLTPTLRRVGLLHPEAPNFQSQSECEATTQLPKKKRTKTR